MPKLTINDGSRVRSQYLKVMPIVCIISGCRDESSELIKVDLREIFSYFSLTASYQAPNHPETYWKVEKTPQEKKKTTLFYAHQSCYEGKHVRDCDIVNISYEMKIQDSEEVHKNSRNFRNLSSILTPLEQGSFIECTKITE